MDPFVIMLIGVPGVGKSTWIEEQKFENCVIASSDKWIEKWAAERSLTYNQAWDQFKRKAADKMDETVRKAVGQNQNVIWDQTNLNRKSRQSKLSMIPQNYKKIAVLFMPDYEVIRARLEKRAKHTGKVIPHNVQTMMFNQFHAGAVDQIYNDFDHVHVIGTPFVLDKYQHEQRPK